MRLFLIFIVLFILAVAELYEELELEQEKLYCFTVLFDLY